MAIHYADEKQGELKPERKLTFSKWNHSCYCTECGDIQLSVSKEGVIEISGGVRLIWDGSLVMKIPVSES